MNSLLPLVLGLAAVAYITLPLWSGASSAPQKRRAPLVVSREQLELDRELGKIDADEYAELDALLPKPQPRVSEGAIESLIGALRRKRRASRAVEAEVLVARARRK